MTGPTGIEQPTLDGACVRLRPFVAQDAPRVAELAGARSIADTTISIPHPYPAKLAREWIQSHPRLWTREQAAHFAVELLHGPLLVGSLSIREIDRAHYQAELGFWTGQPFWGQGLATDAVRTVLPWVFGPMGLNRLYAHHMARNPASGRVLEKAGFRREGLLRRRVLKWGRFEDVVILSILRTDWRGAQLPANRDRDHSSTRVTPP